MIGKKSRTKRILIVVGSFLGASLLLSAIAGLVISLQKQDSGDDIVVGTIEQTAVTFKDVAFSNRRFCFEPDKDDHSGRVSSDGTNYEILSTDLTFRFTNFEMIRGINLKLHVPDYLSEAASKGYIHLPLAASNTDGTTISVDGKNVSNYVVDGNISSYEKCVTYTLSFSWGSLFHGVNPGYYYDLDEEGRQVSDEEMTKTLTDFHALIHDSKETRKDRKVMSLDITPILN